jgi:hypothetical protein
VRDKRQIRQCGTKRDWKFRPKVHGELKVVSDYRDQYGRRFVIKQCERCGEFCVGY